MCALWLPLNLHNAHFQIPDLRCLNWWEGSVMSNVTHCIYSSILLKYKIISDVVQSNCEINVVCFTVCKYNIMMNKVVQHHLHK